MAADQTRLRGPTQAPPPPPPDPNAAANAAEAARLAETQKKGRASTVLTGPRGGGQVTSSSRTLLGA